MSNSLWNHGLYSPWNSPGQNTGVGSLSLLQGIFLTQGSNPGLLHCRWIFLPAEPQGNLFLLEHNLKSTNNSCVQKDPSGREIWWKKITAGSQFKFSSNTSFSVAPVNLQGARLQGVVFSPSGGPHVALERRAPKQENSNGRIRQNLGGLATKWLLVKIHLHQGDLQLTDSFSCRWGHPLGR